ncbi:hypothetical protein BH23CHL7_BH23CHL7_17400 [soil metagenome]
MPSIGDATKPSGAYYLWSRHSSENQEAFLFTMPERGKITRIGIWARADTQFSGSTSFRTCVWAKGASLSAGNDLLGQSDLFTVTAASMALANLLKYEADLLSPVELEAGAQFYAGFARNPNGSHQWATQQTGSHIHRRRTTWPGSMNDYDNHDGAVRGIYVANYDPVSGAWVRRGGVWVRAEGVFVRRAGAWVDVTSVQVRRSGAWVDAD